MIKKIAILGSTGSIGEKLIKILYKDKSHYRIKLLSTNKNLRKIIFQAKTFNVKNVIINDQKTFLYAKKKYKKLNINFYSSFLEINNLFKKKELDYSMVSIVGIDGLSPLLDLIKYSKKIAIANKESIICGWSLIKKQLEIYNTSFIPIDSEHFSIYSLLNQKISQHQNNIEKIYITASGGPFLNYTLQSLKKVDKKKALNHPTWKMGNKISIDSSTMMNKVFEVIEAKKIFNLKFRQISILTHPNSYIHAIVKFNNALAKILIHDPDMKIPIHNSLLSKKKTIISSKKINLDILNNLNLKEINIKNFPLVKILDNLSDTESLYETVLVSINDFFVMKFLDNQINYYSMIKLILKFSNSKVFLKYKKIKPNKIEDIINLKDYVTFKLSKISV